VHAAGGHDAEGEIARGEQPVLDQGRQRPRCAAAMSRHVGIIASRRVNAGRQA